MFVKNLYLHLKNLLSQCKYSLFIVLPTLSVILSCGNSNTFVGNGNIFSKDAQDMLDSLSNNTTKYYEMTEGFSEKSQVIVLASHGGPVEDLETDQFYNYHSLFAVAYVYQAQHLESEEDGLDKSLLSGDRIISIKEAQKANLKSSAILYKVAKHFKDQGKKVYLLTHSFGSFLALYTLVHYRNIFDKMLIKAGRINMPENIVESIIERCYGYFKEDAVTFVETSCDFVKKKIKERFEREKQNGKIEDIEKIFKIRRSSEILKGAVGKPRYLELLKNENLGNLMYVSGTKDRNVGRLLAKEIAFLRDKKALYIELVEKHGLKDPTPFKTLPTTASLLGDDFNSKLHNFFSSPLASEYKLLDMPNNEEMKYYLGNGETISTSDSKYDIGIIFENHSTRQISYKLNALFGDGDFSLFKTNVFKNHKSKFRIQFGQISQNQDKNELSITSDNASVTKQKLAEIHLKLTPISKSVSHFQYEKANSFISKEIKENLPTKENQKYYFDPLLLKNEYAKNNLTAVQQQHKTQIQRSRDRFINFLKNSHNISKEFDLVIYVSDGLPRGYAPREPQSVHPAPKVIYLPSFDFISGWVPTMGIHSDYFAVTGVHEIGHAFGNLADEYHAYETESLIDTPTITDITQENQNKFRNNCFDRYETTEFSESTLDRSSVIFSHLLHINKTDDSKKIFFPQGIQEADKASVLDFKFGLTSPPLNPWSHKSKVPYSPNRNSDTEEENGFILNYYGSLYAGCNGGKSFRGTENSIMNYFLRYTYKTWKSAWGPINSYYLLRAMKEYE